MICLTHNNRERPTDDHDQAGMTAARPTRGTVWAVRVVFAAACLLFLTLFGLAATVAAVLLCAIACVWMPTELNRHSVRIERGPSK